MDQRAFRASSDADTGLEGTMQQLKLQDCPHFLRTGKCAFGSKCRYNHPSAEKLQVAFSNNEMDVLRDQPGQNECQFYMKTGTCKFGSACRYYHPQPKSATCQIQLNFLGLPLRPGEKECTFYLQTGSCKFGSACKFNHPQPTTIASMHPPPSPPMYLPNGISTPAYNVCQEGMTWNFERSIMPPGIGVPGPSNLMPMVTASPQHQGQSLQILPSDGATQVFHRGPIYSQAPGFVPSGYDPGKSTTTILHGQTVFPERAGQPDCHHYMKTGDCKFGMNCKYHHPKDRATSLPSGLNAMGLPLRPGKQSCPYYIKHGICKFGPVCKFDHPIHVPPSSPPYSPSLSSLNEMPVAPIVPESSSASPGSTVSENLQNSSKDEGKFQNKSTEEHVEALSKNVSAEDCSDSA
ncbi:hypothetical protein KP509_05G067000 [Ceratopteris richardii]|uniref:C3H1-type domain-containing protein n=4 Tax=Ceratopteris richardii TaxID=49495 RepID=A0A8T2URH2_CERRI|nr:hypothetical protein KP509_05G067000 [Ceratopteris richardii]